MRAAFSPTMERPAANGDSESKSWLVRSRIASSWRVSSRWASSRTSTGLRPRSACSAARASAAWGARRAGEKDRGVPDGGHDVGEHAAHSDGEVGQADDDVPRRSKAMAELVNRLALTRSRNPTAGPGWEETGCADFDPRTCCALGHVGPASRLLRPCALEISQGMGWCARTFRCGRSEAVMVRCSLRNECRSPSQGPKWNRPLGSTGEEPHAATVPYRARGALHSQATTIARCRRTAYRHSWRTCSRVPFAAHQGDVPTPILRNAMPPSWRMCW